ncbi:MAG: aspartate kinase [Myxococcales bacterium]|nr:aspartate kinase [Myxococcales bacterium]
MAVQAIPVTKPGRRLAVQKFGGSSLATTDKIAKVAQRIAAERRDGRPIVVVASAMGGRTDALVELATALSDAPEPRELDALLATGESASTALLAMALEDLGVPALSLRGWQAGIRTEGPHGHAHIASIDTTRLRAELDAGRVPVVCGFQGIGPDGCITTLGRGGSDTSAVAVAGALGAACEIYSDVPGVFTADPRYVPSAKLVPCLRYDEMLTYARAGAKVLNTDAVAVARDLRVPIHARSTFEPGDGTLVTSEVPETSVTGVATRRAAFHIRGEADAVATALEAHHLVTRRIRDGRHEALIVLNEGARPEDLEGVVAMGAYGTVSVVGRRAPQLVAAGRAALESVGQHALDVWIEEHALTCVVSGDPQHAARSIHSALIDRRVGRAEVEARA